MPREPIYRLLRDAALTALIASATCTGIGMRLARRRGKRPAALPNAVAHMTDGMPAARRQDWSGHTLRGLALNFAGCMAWACVAEAWASIRPFRQPADALARGAAMASAAYTMDMHVLPARARPAYDKVLARGERLTVYASLAATLTLRAAIAQLAGALGSGPRLG